MLPIHRLLTPSSFKVYYLSLEPKKEIPPALINHEQVRHTSEINPPDVALTKAPDFGSQSGCRFWFKERASVQLINVGLTHWLVVIPCIGVL